MQRAGLRYTEVGPTVLFFSHAAADRVLLGTGTGAFGAATNFAAGSFPASVAVGDFNGDGRPDLVVANGGSNDVVVLLNACGFTGMATSSLSGSVAFQGRGAPGDARWAAPLSVKLFQPGTGTLVMRGAEIPQHFERLSRA